MTEQELRRRVCDQARAWLGLNEADGSHRAIIDTYNQIVPRPRGYKLSYSDPWCAGYVSAVAQALGLCAWIFPECGCGPMIALYQAAGRWMEDDGYLPEPGDIILYDWDDSGVGDCTGAPDHVGIVTSVTGDLITITEGNISDAVGERSLWRDSRHIRGYGLPDYATAAIVLTDPEEPGETDELPDVIEVPSQEGSTPPSESVQLPALPEGWCWVPLPVLEIGDESEAVRGAQYLLRGRGFPVGWMGCDGEFGRLTESAVGKYQLDRGLERDGIIGPETWRSLICETK